MGAGTVVALMDGLTESVAPTEAMVAHMEATAAPMQGMVAPTEDTGATGTARGRPRLLLLLRLWLIPTMDTATVVPMVLLAPMEDTVSLMEAMAVTVSPMVDTACLTEATDTVRGLLRLLLRLRLRLRLVLRLDMEAGTVVALMDIVALMEATAAPLPSTAAPTEATAAHTEATAAHTQATAPMDPRDTPPTTTRGTLTAKAWKNKRGSI